MTRGRVSSSVFWAFVVVLAVLHQDFWAWDDRSLLLGFLPVGLAYHAGYSLVAAATWAVALKVVWPTHLEEWAAEIDDGARPGDHGR